MFGHKWCRPIVTLTMVLFQASVVAAQNPLPLGKASVPEALQNDMSLPLGISFNYTWMTDTIELSDLQLVLNGQPLPPGVVSARSTEHHTNIYAGRFDAWVLPFLNVYGLAAKVGGTADDIKLELVPLPGLPPFPIPASIEVPYDGHLFGVGVTMAVGYRHVFATYDINREWVSVDAFDDTLPVVTQSVRAGLRGTAGRGKVAAYAGATHLGLGSAAVTGVSFVPGLPSATFSLALAPKSAWNGVVGARIEISRRLDVIAEAGFGTRKQFTIMPGFRF